MAKTFERVQAMRILLGVVAIVYSISALAADDALIQKGQEVYKYWCTPCHGSGPGYYGGDMPLPGTDALKTLYDGEKPALLEERTDLTPEFIKFYVRNGVSIMPFFRETEISNHDLDALVAYLSGK